MKKHPYLFIFFCCAIFIGFGWRDLKEGWGKEKVCNCISFCWQTFHNEKRVQLLMMGDRAQIWGHLIFIDWAMIIVSLSRNLFFFVFSVCWLKTKKREKERFQFSFVSIISHHLGGKFKFEALGTFKKPLVKNVFLLLLPPSNVLCVWYIHFPSPLNRIEVEEGRGCKSGVAAHENKKVKKGELKRDNSKERTLGFWRKFPCTLWLVRKTLLLFFLYIYKKKEQTTILKTTQKVLVLFPSLRVFITGLPYDV